MSFHTKKVKNKNVHYPVLSGTLKIKSFFLFFLSLSIAFCSLAIPVRAEENDLKVTENKETIESEYATYQLDYSGTTYSVIVTDKEDYEEDVIEFDTKRNVLYLNGEMIPFEVSEESSLAPAGICSDINTIVTGAPHTYSFNINIPQTAVKIAVIVGMIIAVKTFIAGLTSGGITTSAARKGYESLIKGIAAAEHVLSAGGAISAFVGVVKVKFVFTQQVDGNRCRNINRSYSVTFLGKTKTGSWANGDWFYTSQPI